LRIADVSSAQAVRLGEEALKRRGTAQATECLKQHRPWGWFESLVMGGRFQIKRILAHAGACPGEDATQRHEESTPASGRCAAVAAAVRPRPGGGTPGFERGYDTG
jgi:hypothetical protein